MKTQIQLILATIPLTILIWTYADRAGNDRYVAVVPIKLTPPQLPGSPYVIRVVGAKPDAAQFARATITLRGPRSSIRRIEKDDSSGRFSLSIGLTGELTPGEQTLDLATALRELKDLRDLGLTLLSVSPQVVRYEVDRYRPVQVDVVADAGSFEKTIVGQAVIQPSKVTARVLESVLGDRTTLPPLRVSLEEQLRTRAERGGGVFTVPLKSSWPGIDALFEPDQVLVSVELTRRTQRERITLIPLGVLVKSPEFWTQYDIEWQDQTGAHLTQAIDVRVPMEKAGQLKNTQIDAYIRIEDSDLPDDPVPGVPTTMPVSSSVIEREVQFRFPPGFEDVQIDGTPSKVKFTILRKRTERGPSPPGLSPAIGVTPSVSP